MVASLLERIGEIQQHLEPCSRDLDAKGHTAQSLSDTRSGGRRVAKTLSHPLYLSE